MNLPLEKLLIALLLISGLGSTISSEENSTWPQFRGPQGKGFSSSTLKLPDRLSPKDNVIWKVPLGFGHGTAVIGGGKIFFTTVEDKKLFTLALDQKSGSELWRKPASYSKLESLHRIGSHAQSSCATDGKHVVSFFGSSGLHAYTAEGKHLWSKPMGPFKNGFGAGSSPIIVDNKVVLCQDHDTDSFLWVLDVKTGEPVWKKDRSLFPRGYATPVIWNVDGQKQVVIAGTLSIVAYDLKDGQEIWTVHGIARLVNTTPIIEPKENILYYAGWSPGADPGDRIQAKPFDDLLKEMDSNGNQTLEYKEFGKDSPLRRRFNQIDRDKSDSITRTEYASMKVIFEKAQNIFMAVLPGGKGDITQTHVKWKSSRFLPYVPSPLHYQGTLFLVKNGGIVSSWNPENGKQIKVGRVSARGDYYASPTGGDGKVYFASEKGEVCVISAEAQWKELSHSKFSERIYASPAIVDGKIYLRTESALYCFGLK